MRIGSLRKSLEWETGTLPEGKGCSGTTSMLGVQDFGFPKWVSEKSCGGGEVEE